MEGNYTMVDWRGIRRNEDEIFFKSIYLFVKLKELNKRKKAIEYDHFKQIF